MPNTPLGRLRSIALSLPGTLEARAWGEPTFRVRGKIFAMYANAENHHGAGRPAVWIKAAPANQALMIKAAPHRFFSPPYVGPGGWIGIWLDGTVPWTIVRQLLTDAWRLSAPKRLLTALDAPVGITALPRKPKLPRRVKRRARRSRVGA